MATTVVISKPPLLRLVLLQLIATTLLSLALCWYRDWAWLAWLATMIGGAIATSTWFYFAWRSFLHSAEDANPHSLLADVYQATIARVLMTGLALALVFKFADQLDKPLLLIGFVVTSVFAAICSALFIPTGEIGEQQLSQSDSD